MSYEDIHSIPTSVMVNELRKCEGAETIDVETIYKSANGQAIVLVIVD